MQELEVIIQGWVFSSCSRCLFFSSFGGWEGGRVNLYAQVISQAKKCEGQERKRTIRPTIRMCEYLGVEEVVTALLLGGLKLLSLVDLRTRPVKSETVGRLRKQILYRWAIMTVSSKSKRMQMSPCKKARSQLNIKLWKIICLEFDGFLCNSFISLSL